MIDSPASPRATLPIGSLPRAVPLCRLLGLGRGRGSLLSVSLDRGWAQAANNQGRRLVRNSNSLRQVKDAPAACGQTGWGQVFRGQGYNNKYRGQCFEERPGSGSVQG